MEREPGTKRVAKSPASPLLPAGAIGRDRRPGGGAWPGVRWGSRSAPRGWSNIRANATLSRDGWMHDALMQAWRQVVGDGQPALRFGTDLSDRLRDASAALHWRTTSAGRRLGNPDEAGGKLLHLLWTLLPGQPQLNRWFAPRFSPHTSYCVYFSTFPGQTSSRDQVAHITSVSGQQ
jgi:hypothetical protein